MLACTELMHRQVKRGCFRSSPPSRATTQYVFLLSVLFFTKSCASSQKPHVIELRGTTRGSSSSTTTTKLAGQPSVAPPAAAGAASAVNLSGSGSGTLGQQAAAAAGGRGAGPLSPRGNLPRAQSAAAAVSSRGEGQYAMPRSAAGQQPHPGGAGRGSSPAFFLPPLDVDAPQRGSGAGHMTSSGAGQQYSHHHTERPVSFSSTPPPSPAMDADAGAGREGHRHAASAAGGEGGSGHAVLADAAGSAGGRASHTGQMGAAAAARHSTGGGGAVTVFDRKVYVSVYADGPTKVLCFSDDPLWTGGSEADEGGDALQLLSRLHQVARQLLSVDRQLELYQGAAYGLRPARGSRAVPALLLLQQQQQQQGSSMMVARRGSIVSGGGMDGAAAAAAASTAQRQDQHQRHSQELPVLLQGAVACPGSAANAGSTASAALALLQQMNRPAAQQQQQHNQQHQHSHSSAVGRGAVTTYGGGRGSEVSVDSTAWPGAVAAAALGAHTLSGLDGAFGHDSNNNAALPVVEGQHGSSAAARLLSLSPQTAMTQSHVSARPLAGVAAAAAAGVRVAGGLLGAEGGLDGGVRLYYDKLTLLLDSQLPLGGNVKVGVGMRFLFEGC